MSAWGLKNTNLTFIRREIRMLVFKYISQGLASVEYQSRQHHLSRIICSHRIPTTDGQIPACVQCFYRRIEFFFPNLLILFYFPDFS